MINLTIAIIWAFAISAYSIPTNHELHIPRVFPISLVLPRVYKAVGFPFVTTATNGAKRNMSNGNLKIEKRYIAVIGADRERPELCSSRHSDQSLPIST